MIYLITPHGFIFTAILCISRSICSQSIRPEQSEFKSYPQVKTHLEDSLSLFEMSNSREIIKIDLNRPLKQQAIVIRNSKTVKINLYCTIRRPSSLKRKDVKTQLCYQASLLRNVICSDLSITECKTNLFGMMMSVKSIRNETGFKIVMDSSLSNDDDDLSGYYYCKSSTIASGVVLSNLMEIRDIIFWEKNLIPSPRQVVREQYKQALNVTQMPKSFTCLEQVNSFILKGVPHWIDLEFQSIVKWAWCPVTRQRSNLVELEKTYMQECLTQIISKCHKTHYLCPYKSHTMPGWKEFISFEGTITLISGQKFPDYGNKLDGYALMCYYRSQDNYKALRFIAHNYGEREILKGLQWVSGVNDRSSIDVISPMKQTVRVGILKKGFTLTAFYYPSSYLTYQWTRNGKPILNSTEWSITQYSLQFRQTVSFDNEGDYHLQIKSGHQEIEFIFDVRISSPPFLVNIATATKTSAVYAMDGSNVSVVYQYQANPTNVFVYINGLVFIPGTSDQTVFMNDLTRISKHLKNLDFSVTRKNRFKEVYLIYNVTKASFSKPSMTPQDHSLIVEARNAYGISRSHLNIIVLKMPTIINLPKNDSCFMLCSSLESHFFRCEINDDYYKNKDVIVEKFWMLNDLRLDWQPFYSTFFTEDSKGLYLKPVKSNNSDFDATLKTLLKKANLVCHIRLLYPNSLGLSEQDLINENRIIFDSVNDPYFVKYSAAFIKMETKLANSSYTWVVFVMIVLLLLIMFVFLLVRLGIRDQEKSYQMEQTSINHPETPTPRYTMADISSIFRLCNIPQNTEHNNTRRTLQATTNELSFRERLLMCLSQNRPRLASVNIDETGLNQLLRSTFHDSKSVERLNISKGISRDEEMAENDTMESYIRPNSPENGMNLSTNRSIYIGYKSEEPIGNETELEDVGRFYEDGSFVGIYTSNEDLSENNN